MSFTILFYWIKKFKYICLFILYMHYTHWILFFPVHYSFSFVQRIRGYLSVLRIVILAARGLFIVKWSPCVLPLSSVKCYSLFSIISLFDSISTSKWVKFVEKTKFNNENEKHTDNTNSYQRSRISHISFVVDKCNNIKQLCSLPFSGNYINWKT